MGELKRYARLYKVFAVQYTKTMMQSKSDFFLGFFGFLLTQSMGIITLAVIFQNIPAIDGYTFEQMIFIYGFFQLPRGLDHLLTDNIWLLAGGKVVRGEVDRFYLRPINPYFQLIVERLQFDGLGELVLGIVIVVYSAMNGVFEVNFMNISMLVITTIVGSVIYTSIKLIFASLAFWIKLSQPIMFTAYSFTEFAKYPISIFPKFMQFILMFIIPFAFTGYIPASYIMGTAEFLGTVGLQIVIASVLWVIAYTIFNRGLLAYESAGN